MTKARGYPRWAQIQLFRQHVSKHPNHTGFALTMSQSLASSVPISPQLLITQMEAAAIHDVIIVQSTLLENYLFPKLLSMLHLLQHVTLMYLSVYYSNHQDSMDTTFHQIMNQAITLYAGCLGFAGFLVTCGPGINRSCLSGSLISFLTATVCSKAIQCRRHFGPIKIQSTCSSLIFLTTGPMSWKGPLMYTNCLLPA